jgi:hypothetical protein
MGIVETMHQQNLDIYRDYNVWLAHCNSIFTWSECATRCNLEAWQTASNNFNVDAANYIASQTGTSEVMVDSTTGLASQNGVVPIIG